MMIDGLLNFAKQQALAGGAADVVSTNVHDCAPVSPNTPKKLFAGSGEPVKVAIQVTAAGGTAPTFRARLVGADNAALTTNPEIIADTGVSPAIVASDLPLLRELVPVNQIVAKRYYGVIFTQSGADHTATVNAAIVKDAQSRLVK